ncbi:MAG: GNAT family N-acetyltransferase [Desulfosporosinus sp.]|nr:GNAT family N-acetyltransferase [Desulfosporosinus sp.]
MFEVRLAQKGEMDHQKDLWKRCFGDSDSFIDFYYANRYKEDQTAVLLHEGEILAMLTMVPVRTVLPDNRNFKTAMLYAIATHPEYQNIGFAARLMDFSNHYLKTLKTELSVLVPAKEQLFDYYRKQGYQVKFYIRETQFFRDRFERRAYDQSCKCMVSEVTPQEYNCRRNKQLNGRLFIAYSDEDIAYQKKLSQLSGVDIYAIDIAEIQGCLAVERITPDKVLIKEILLPENLMNVAIQQIVRQLSAKEYVLRIPPYFGEDLGGCIRPFGMIRVNREFDWVTPPEGLGYLGFAFD